MARETRDFVPKTTTDIKDDSVQKNYRDAFHSSLGVYNLTQNVEIVLQQVLFYEKIWHDQLSLGPLHIFTGWITTMILSHRNMARHEKWR